MKFNDNFRTNKPFPRLPERQPRNLPREPINAFVISPFINGILDIRWDDPKLIPENTAFEILGANLYRSFDSEEGPYIQINTASLGVGIYRDITSSTLIEDEAVENLEKGNNPQREWRFKTKFSPIVKDVLEPSTFETRSNQPAEPEDVIVKVDSGDGKGLLEVPLFKFHALTGEITLCSNDFLEASTQKLIPPRLPAPGDGNVTITYCINTNLIKSKLHNRIFYKLTTVGKNSDGEIVESDIKLVKAINLYQQEVTDWIWKEAVRRNRWILEQGGERVKIFIRKWNGEICPEHSEQHVNTIYDCEICFGTNFQGGYEGPFDVIIAPPDTEKNIELTEIGLRTNYVWETWTGPSPLLNKRDVIVRPTGERFTIGAINYQGQRGAIFQQTFQISQLDSEDIIYRLPIEGVVNQNVVPVDRPTAPDNTWNDRETPASPVITRPADFNTRNYPRTKGRTVTFEDIVW